MNYNMDNIDQYKTIEIINILTNYKDLMTYNTQENLLNKLDTLEAADLSKIRQTLELISAINGTDVPVLQQLLSTMKNELETFIANK